MALVGAIVSGCDRDERRRALVGVAHALEGPLVADDAAEHLEVVHPRWVADRLTAAEDHLESRASHERREDEIREEALVALAAPRRRAGRPDPAGTRGCSS